MCNQPVAMWNKPLSTRIGARDVKLDVNCTTWQYFFFS